jgi:hypothetical protein
MFLGIFPPTTKTKGNIKNIFLSLKITSYFIFKKFNSCMFVALFFSSCNEITPKDKLYV